MKIVIRSGVVERIQSRNFFHFFPSLNDNNNVQLSQLSSIKSLCSNKVKCDLCGILKWNAILSSLNPFKGTVLGWKVNIASSELKTNKNRNWVESEFFVLSQGCRKDDPIFVERVESERRKKFIHRSSWILIFTMLLYVCSVFVRMTISSFFL
jgi:hypothetical protein